jgi:hypothetical protein
MKFSAAIALATATTVGAFAPTTFVGRSSNPLNIAVGDSLPSVEVMKGFPEVEKINVADYAKGKKMVLVGLPGAFTPT